MHSSTSGFRKPVGYEQYRSKAELATYLGVSSKTISRWHAAAKIPAPYVTTAGVKLWSPEQCQEILEWRISQLPSEKAKSRRITKA